MINTVYFFNYGELACRILTIVTKPDTKERDGFRRNFIVTHVEFFLYAL
jgi:hypothetical protein